MEFEILKDKILTKIEKVDDDNDITELIFTCSDGRRYTLYHGQECCEWVRIEDINGNLEDLLNSPLTMAECVSSRDFGECNDVSCTWTFYKMATIKGYVTIRWIGESNGYYSEKVYFDEIIKYEQAKS